jgi:SWI/SNF-related matrix-associated actin-dependent regulator 1 of chromatin subfamily A
VEIEPLLPYQVVGSEWLARTDQALLADEMGLGKTAQAITACDLVSAARILVVCPAAARANWAREFERFSPFDRPVVVLGRDAPVGARDGVSVCSFDYASDPQNLRGLLAARWDVLVVDEAHYLKTKDSTRTYAIYKHLAPRARRVWRLSGTPSPNGRPDELWPHLVSAGITTLPLDAFQRRFCAGYDSAYGFRVTGPRLDHLPELKALLAKMTLRRTVKEVAPELPPVRHELVHVEAAPVDEELWFTEHMITSEARHMFHESLRKATEGLKTLLSLPTKDRTEQRTGILDNMARSTPIAMLRRYMGLSKVPAMLEILTGELKHDHSYKVVIFAAHKDVVVSMQHGLSKFGAVSFFGGMPEAKRQKHLRKFSSDPTCRVIVGHIQAMGTAVDGLQNQCTEVVIAEASWVPGENAQAVMRVHRRGVSGPVRVRWFAVDGSIDSQVANILKRKADAETKIFC